MTIQEPIKKQHQNITKQTTSIVASGTELRTVKLRVLWQLFRVMLKKSGGFLRALNLIKQIKEKYQRTFGEPLLTKIAKVDGRYFWRLAAPGFPSKASVRMHENEANRFIPNQAPTGLRSLLFAITKKCPMNCEHCFEWDNLKKKEELSTTDIIRIIHKYQDYGTTQMMLSGGEPMLRVNDLYKVLKAAKEGTDFWIITSGLGLTLDRAQKLKEAGLTGVMVSIDHHKPDQHNEFRGYDNAFEVAIIAVLNANKAGLVTTLSLCATRDFCTKENLATYMKLANTLGVSFVQIVEPRATGRYSGKDVELGAKEIALLEETYIAYNTSKKYKDFPIVNYLGYHQRKVGCFGAGDRFFYIDTDGDAHICPFCANKVGNALRFSAKDMVGLLQEHACFDFDRSSL